MTSALSTTTKTTSRGNSRSGGNARRRKPGRKSRRKQQRPPTQRSTVVQTGTGNAPSSPTHVTDYSHEITTPTSGRSAAVSRSRVPAERRPLNRKLTSTNRKTGNSHVSSSVLLSPIATAVSYVNIGVETRRNDVTSGELVHDEAGISSLATVVGLATVSVLAFWLIVTVIILSCLLARRTTKMSSSKPRTGCVVDNRWSWSRNQLIGLLDDGIDAPPPPEENARLFSAAAERFDISPVARWNSTSAAHDTRMLKAYRFIRQQRTSPDEFYRRRPASQSELVDSAYDTLAAAAAILDAPPEVCETPEVMYVECGETEVWTRQAAVPTEWQVGCSARQSEDDYLRTNQLTSQRRFPRMGQSCLHRASPLRPVTAAAQPRRSDTADCRARLTGYMPVPPSDTTIDIVGTTAV